MMSRVWAFFIIAAVAFGILSGRTAQVSRAAVEGASASVELILSITGMMCLWSGLMNVMKKSGLAAKISAFLRPVLKRLFKKASSDETAMEAVSANVTANLLGLSNAATPLGLRAAARISELLPGREAMDDLLLLIVINSSSLQIIPSTVAAVRASYGSSAPYDILLSVWMASAVSVTSTVTAALLLRRKSWRKDV